VKFVTYWGRYKKEQSFIAHPAKQRDVYKSRMEDKYYASIQKPVAGISLQQEEQAETIAEATKKTSGGFWNSLLGAFASKKEVTEVKRPRWPAKQ